VLAVGSPHGDDQAGWQVVERLQREPVEGIEAILVRTPLELLEHLKPRAALVIVDACRSGAEPGTILRTEWPDSRLGGCDGPSTHGFGVVRVLELAAALGRLPSRVVLLGVEANACGPAGKVSPAVTHALDELYALVLAESAKGRRA
jgi:hydrogenase maturation protease